MAKQSGGSSLDEQAFHALEDALTPEQVNDESDGAAEMRGNTAQKDDVMTTSSRTGGEHATASRPKSPEFRPANDPGRFSSQRVLRVFDRSSTVHALRNSTIMAAGWLGLGVAGTFVALGSKIFSARSFTEFMSIDGIGVAATLTLVPVFE